MHLLKIAVPGYNSKEFKYIVTLTLLLILRTQMSIWLADVNGKVVKAIVELDFNKFCLRVSRVFLTYINLIDNKFDAIFNPKFGGKLWYGIFYKTIISFIQMQAY
jgi:hypothetical protein